MSYCPFELAQQKWTCPFCEWSCPAANPVARPRRRCPSLSGPPVAPTLTELLARVRADLAERLSAAELRDAWPAIGRRVAICHGSDCEQFNGHHCTDRGTACTKRKRWIERLAIGQCERWGEESG